MKVSVVLAAYNGEKYIARQIESILAGLPKNGELIVSDDGSNDCTVDIVLRYAEADSRVKILKGPKKGVVSNFENALNSVSGDVIFFADQDDIWDALKIEKVVDEFRKNDKIWLVLHDMFLSTDEEINNGQKGRKSFDVRKRRHGVLYNFLYSGYYGCCMAMSKELLDIVLPFPKGTNMYDQLIGLIAEKKKKSVFLSEALIEHRLHGNNMSEKKGLFGKIKFRAALLKTYLQVKKRLKK